MATTALVVSIVAALISGASVWYTRRQATAAEATRAIEAERRHDELTPDLEGEYVAADPKADRPRPQVRLMNRGPVDLLRVELQEIPPHRLDEAVTDGLYDQRTGGSLPTVETGVLPRRHSWTFDVLPVPDPPGGMAPGGVLALRCRCYADGHDPWVVVVEVDFPHPPAAARVTTARFEQ